MCRVYLESLKKTKESKLFNAMVNYVREKEQSIA